MSTLKRPLNPVPDYVMDALNERDLMQHYLLRPAYQRNDYIGWISRAKREDTRRKRLEQMLDELEAGNRYMKMEYDAKMPR